MLPVTKSSPSRVAAFGMLLIALTGPACVGATTQTRDSRAVFVCPVTQPNGWRYSQEPQGGNFGNAQLGTEIPQEGARVIPNRPNPNALAVKWGWWRLIPGRLSISGRRLDTSAPPLEADIPSGYGDMGFQSSALNFPTLGCWSVTGRVGNSSLTFVTLVQKS